MSDDRIFTATRLKAELLAVLDDVQAGGEPVLVTKHGRAVARIVPVDHPAELVGSVTFLVDDDALIAPIDVTWAAQEE